MVALGTIGAEPSPAVGDILELSAAVHRHPDRLVHGRSWTPALDGLWRVAHRGLRHSVSDGARGARFSDCLLSRLHFIFVFGALYIHRLLRIGPVGRLAQPAAAAVPNRPLSVVDEPLPAEAPGE